MNAAKRIWKAAVTGLAVVTSMAPGQVSACAVCYGEPDSPAARGLTWAILALGVVVVMVLAGAVAFFVQAARKSELIQATEAASSMVEKH